MSGSVASSGSRKRRNGNSQQQELGLLAKVVIAIAIVLVVSGVLWLGPCFRDDRAGAAPARRAARRADDVPLYPAAGYGSARGPRRPKRRATGPRSVPVDHAHRPGERGARLREAANATARIILLGLVMDAIYQLFVLQRFYPVEAVIIAVLLAFVPTGVPGWSCDRAQRARRRLCPSSLTRTPSMENPDHRRSGPGSKSG